MGHLLKITKLGVTFKTSEGRVNAVVEASLDVKRGQRIGIIGESGSGKSVMARAIMGLNNPRFTDFAVDSKIELDGIDILSLNERELGLLRGEVVSIVFQNPMNSLNPCFTIGTQMRYVLQAHRKINRTLARHIIVSALKDVDLPSAELLVHRYPHELSGGQKQRVMIAMAILCEPKLIIADEPTSALDVTAQDTVLNVLIRLSKEKDIAIMMITHDMGVVARFCERVNVMYGGYIVEQADVKTLFSNPAHPYTAALLAATPDPSQSKQVLQAIPGIQRTRIGMQPNSCPFIDRCAFSKTECKTPPVPVEIVKGHKTTCHFAGQLDLSV